jgi:hypothetical protein
VNEKGSEKSCEKPLETGWELPEEIPEEVSLGIIFRSLQPIKLRSCLVASSAVRRQIASLSSTSCPKGS